MISAVYKRLHFLTKMIIVFSSILVLYTTSHLYSSSAFQHNPFKPLTEFNTNWKNWKISHVDKVESSITSTKPFYCRFIPPPTIITYCGRNYNTRLWDWLFVCFFKHHYHTTIFQQTTTHGGIIWKKGNFYGDMFRI